MAEVELVEHENHSNEKEIFSTSSSKEDYLNKALTYQSLSDNQKAVECFEKALKLDPNYTEALISQGNSHLSLGNKEKALLSFQKALKLEDNYLLDINKISPKTCKKLLRGFNKNLILALVFLLMIIIGLIVAVIKVRSHYIKKKNKSWQVTGGIISYLLNERNEKNVNNKRLFLYKEDIIETNNIKNKLHIALTFDSNFIYPPLVLMTSILENNDKEKNLVVFHLIWPQDFDLTQISILESLKNKYEVKINYYLFPNLFNMFKKWHSSYTIYFKLFIPLMFSDLDRMIYLDSDALVFKDLLEMYNLPFNDNYILGYPSHDAEYIDHLVDKVEAYINAGALLFNIKKIRNDNKDIELIQYAFDKNEYFTFYEQDAMNVVFAPKIGILPLKYGVLLYDIKIYDHLLKNRIRIAIDRNELKNAIDDPSIIHFSLCNPKVWYANSKNYYRQNYICKKYHEIFYYYAKKTEYYSEIYKKFVQKGK